MTSVSLRAPSSSKLSASSSAASSSSSSEPPTEPLSVKPLSVKPLSVERPPVDSLNTDPPSNQPLHAKPSFAERSPMAPPFTERPLVERASIERPLIEQPLVEQPLIEQPPTERPAVQPLLRLANSHLVLLIEVLETYRADDSAQEACPQMDVLARLRTELVSAMNTYRIAYQECAPLNVQLMRESDLMWQCNQCDYYLSQRKGQPLVAFSSDRGLWQIRRTIRAVVRLKLLTHVRQFMPGLNTLSFPWRDLFPRVRR